MKKNFKSAVAFFFLFFLHGTSIGNGQQGISYNSWNDAMSTKANGGGCGIGIYGCRETERDFSPGAPFD